MPRITPGQKAIVQDYAQAFGSASGQRVLEDLYRSFGRHTSFVKGDPYETAFNEGARSVYLKIRLMLRLDRLPEEEPEDEEEPL